MTTLRDRYHHGDLRESLLRAAEKMMDTEASPRFSLRELAREAGVSHAAPYKHFQNRDELVLALAERWMGQFVRAQSAAIGTTDARSDLLALGAAYVRYAGTYPSRFLTIFDPTINRPDQPPSPAFADLVREHTDLLNQAVASAVDDGVISSHTPSVAAALWAQAHGLATLVLLGYLHDPDVEPALAALLNSPIPS